MNHKRVLAALFHMLLGVALLWVFSRQFSQPLAAGWIGMIGVCLILHFGLLAFLAEAWRAGGYPVEPIMNRPLTATSVSDFWGRRWNRPFNELAVECAFRPVARRWGVSAGTAGAFLFSGLLHEIVISWPAQGGWGLPTLYFAIQGAALLAERRWSLQGRIWTLAVLMVPAFLLFHPPFILRVMIPFFHAIGALPLNPILS
ncbi:MAG: MBOAT family protein [Verrucomicrobiales bacterium]